MASAVSVIETPCNKICVVHPVLKLCIGCGRTLDEIAGWTELDPAQRARIMAQLPARLAALSGAAGAAPIAVATS